LSSKWLKSKWLNGAESLNLPEQVRVHLARNATDMRKAFDGLCTIAKYQFHRDPFNGHGSRSSSVRGCGHVR